MEAVELSLEGLKLVRSRFASNSREILAYRFADLIYVGAKSPDQVIAYLLERK